MIRRFLEWLGYEVVYVSEWGEKKYRYDYLDHVQTRPIHKGMSVAPPWAKRLIRKKPTSINNPKG